MSILYVREKLKLDKIKLDFFLLTNNPHLKVLGFLKILSLGSAALKHILLGISYSFDLPKLRPNFSLVGNLPSPSIINFANMLLC